MTQKTKTFDCIAMKREIQERIYEDTKHMNHDEFAEYIRNRIKTSEFADFLDRPVSGNARTEK